MKEKIIDAAIKEFKQKGLKFTMSDVAKRQIGRASCRERV